MRVRALLAIVLIGLAVVLALVAQAPGSGQARHQTMPGLIVFTRFTTIGPGADSEGALYLVRADGSGLRALTESSADPPTEARLSPEASKVAYVGDAPTDYGCVILSIRQGATPRIFRKGSCSWSPTWSPSGTRLAYATEDGRIATVAVNGSGVRWMPRSVTTTRTSLTNSEPGLDWSHDDTTIAFGVDLPGYHAAVDLVRSDGSGLRHLAAGAMSPRWSPDGRTLLIQSTSAHALYTINRNGTGRHLLFTLSEENVLFDAVWSADGRAVLYSDRSGLRIYNLASRTSRRFPLPSSFCAGIHHCGYLDSR
jgi:Tol biopolymer transport system component